MNDLFRHKIIVFWSNSFTGVTAGFKNNNNKYIYITYKFQSVACDDADFVLFIVLRCGLH